MIALTWQTMLLLTLAYFAGCFVGCLARKIVGAGAATAVPAGVPVAVPVAAPRPREVARAVAPPAAQEEPEPTGTRHLAPRGAPPAFRRADKDTPEDAAPEPAPEPEPPAREPPPSRPATQPIVSPPISAAAAAAAAAAAQMAAAAPPPAPAPAAADDDDLTRIRAIDAPLAEKLNQLGVSRYAEIAAWSSENVRAISEALGFSGRIERENWIEQAQILARGGATSYATGLTSSVLRPAASAEAPPLPERGPDVAVRAAFAEPRPVAPPAPPPPAPPKVVGRDSLQRIGGINAEIEQVLNGHDVTRYSQIAGWSAADVQRVEALLGFSGRVNRENWIEQAQILARGGATAYSRTFDERGGPPAPVTAMPVATAPAALEAAPTIVVAASAPPPAPPAEAPAVESPAAERAPDLSGMRSVRSEAFRAPDSIAATAPAEPDDLKRIRGVGLLIERKLNAMGVSTYEQIANWTADDVSTVNAKLEFKGRIERENWIEQARILASGGHTDFSRRFERGEV